MDKQERAFWREAILIFALFAGLFYFPVLFGKIPFPKDIVLQFPAWAGRVPSEARRSYAEIGDLVTFFYPARAFAAQSLKQGVLPLWNPLLLSGEPFLATAQSSLFYPPNILYYLLAVPVAWAACLVLRMFFAALFMAMFVRSIEGSKTGSIFSGIVFASCGFMTAWQGQPMSDGAIWLPFACCAVHRLHKTASSSSIALAAVAFAMPVLAGHPETAAHVTLIGAMLALMLWVFVPEPGAPRLNPRFIVRFGLAGVLALGIASVQMIPTLEWLWQIGDVFRPVWPALAPHQLLGWVSRDILRDTSSAGINIPESAAYMAMISILAAPLAVFHRSKFYIVFLAGVTLFAIGVAYGVEPMYGLASRAPVLGALKNSRLILAANFAIAALSGLGISALEEQVQFAFKKRLAALGLVSSIFAIAFVLVHRLQLATTFRVEFTHRPSFARTLLILGLFPLVWKFYGGLRGRAFPIVVCGFAILDLGTFGFGYMGFSSRDAIFPASPAFDFLKHNDISPFRIVQIGPPPYSWNAPVIYGLQSADGYEVRLPRLQRAFSQDLIDPNSDGINFVPDRIIEGKDRRLDLLNVKYLVLTAYTPEFNQFAQSDRFVQVFNNRNVAIFENKSVLPRAWVVPASGIEILPGIEPQLRLLKDPAFDPTKRAILSEVPEPFRQLPGDAGGQVFQGHADVIESGINGTTLRSEASAPAMLVVSQTYYPGWKATIDGKSAQIVAADLALTAVPVPAGAHEVRLLFQPASFRIGLALTILSIIIVLAMIIARGVRL